MRIGLYINLYGLLNDISLLYVTQYKHCKSYGNMTGMTFEGKGHRICETIHFPKKKVKDF